MYGWKADSSRFAAVKRTFNVRAMNEVEPHALVAKAHKAVTFHVVRRGFSPGVGKGVSPDPQTPHPSLGAAYASSHSFD